MLPALRYPRVIHTEREYFVESLKDVFAFIGVVVGTMTGCLALAKTYLDLKKRLAEEKAAKAAAAQVVVVPKLNSVPASPAVEQPPEILIPVDPLPELPVATPTPPPAKQLTPAPTLPTSATVKDHDKAMMGFVLQFIGIVIILGGVALLAYPMIYPPPIKFDLTQPMEQPNEKVRTGIFAWPGPSYILFAIGYAIWNLGKRK